jgi:hypothetical protein
MINQIISIPKFSRGPGRPFNTTRYPWRSTAIGRSFYLRPGKMPGMRMIYQLKAEGFQYEAVETDRGYKMVRLG